MGLIERRPVDAAQVGRVEKPAVSRLARHEDDPVVEQRGPERAQVLVAAVEAAPVVGSEEVGGTALVGARVERGRNFDHAVAVVPGVRAVGLESVAGDDIDVAGGVDGGARRPPDGSAPLA